MPEPLLIGIGNELRGDDGAGLRVIELLTELGVEAFGHDGEPLTLLDSFAGRTRVVIVDAVAGERPGRIHRFDAAAEPLPALFTTGSSTHLLGLAETLELGRELDRLPAQLEVIGIEGTSFGLGLPLAWAVDEAAGRVARDLAADLRKATPEPDQSRDSATRRR